MSPEPKRRNLTVDEARARMLAGVAALAAEDVPLDRASGRVLAEPIAALRDQPPFDASAMDGWALRRADARPGARLRIVGESAAGHGFIGTVAPGEAARIFTGAPVPDGADWVVIQENARRDGDHVLLEDALGPSDGHVRPRGCDLKAGETVLAAGDRLDPWRLALAAAAGAQALSVVRRPRIAVLAHGEELIAPGAAPQPWQIPDTGGPGVCALVEAWGGEPERLRAVGDEKAAIAASVAGAAADLVVVIGGASVGDHDLVKPALADLGLKLAVETIDVRPGKPTWFGILGDGRPVLGLPGNPASAFVCAELFLKPLVQAMLGRPAQPVLVPAVLQGDLPANGSREQWMRAALDQDETGHLRVTPFARQDSSLVGVFARADALLRRESGAPEANLGQIVKILRLDRLP